MDPYEALMGNVPTDDASRAALAAALRGQNAYGQLLTMTNDPGMTRVGSNLMDASSQAQKIGVLGQDQRDLAQRALGEADAAQARRDALAEDIRQHNLEHQDRMAAQGSDVDPDQPLSGSNEALAQQIASYNAAPLNASNTRNPLNKQIMARVWSINPTYRQEYFPLIKKAEQDYGPGGKPGQQIIAGSNLIMHGEHELKPAIAALANGTFQPTNTLFNRAKELVGSATPTNLQIVGTMVGDEVAKFAIPGGATGAERDAWVKNFADTNRSPQQLMGALEHVYGMAAQQFGNHKQAYNANTFGARDDFETRILRPDVLAVVSDPKYQSGLNPPANSGWSARPIP